MKAFLPTSSPTVVALLVIASEAPLAACPALAPIPPAIAPVRIAVPRPSLAFLPSERFVKAFVAPPETLPPMVPEPIVMATLVPV